MRTFFINILALSGLLRYSLFNRRIYRDEKVVFQSNFIAAFGHTFTRLQRLKYCYLYLLMMQRQFLEYFLNNTFINVGPWNYLLIYVRKITSQKNHPIARYIQNAIDGRTKKISRDTNEINRQFFRYYRKMNLRNAGILSEIMHQNKGALLCCFHTGAYRALPDMLSTFGYKVNLLVDQRVYREQLSGIMQKWKDKKRIASIQRFDVIIAENPNIASLIFKKLNNNEIVLFYLDGNTGSGKRSAKGIKVPFFQQMIYARSGAIQLAIANNTPIIPLLSTWNLLKRPSFVLKNPVPVDHKKRQKTEAQNVTQRLYHFYISMLEREPWQWDQWGIAHRYWVTTDKQPEINQEQFENLREEITRKVKQPRKVRVEWNEYKLGIIPGNSGLAIMDLENPKYYTAKGLMHDLFQRLKYKSIRVNELLRSNSESDVINVLTFLKYRDFIKL